MSITVATLKKGQKGVIKDFTDNDLPIKLLELGCLPGNTVELVQRAPLNDPIYINVNGSHIAIRTDLAQKIELDLIEADHQQ
ncbi:ferrous iron transport protein A [Euzebyella marina]|uniref:Ferrous iron transport protein A n=1 Tax=Euzebyella marina TaxID=1761453 RepID=A0A3G2L207_9FLAO|nr:FeoA family protein [Euzebyella marina]AYN66290.1 ferrous iron transport protein A [Euzebyella marina]MBG50197.1 ferrous iron transport protein A [Pseudozobellia sp.]